MARSLIRAKPLKRPASREEEAANKYHHLYKTARWLRIRAFQLSEHPLCDMCAEKGIVTVARVAHHPIPHKGNHYLFYCQKLQSLCAECHDGAVQMIEKTGYDKTIGADGFPIDKNHPFYTKKIK